MESFFHVAKFYKSPNSEHFVCCYKFCMFLFLGTTSRQATFGATGTPVPASVRLPPDSHAASDGCQPDWRGELFVRQDQPPDCQRQPPGWQGQPSSCRYDTYLTKTFIHLFEWIVWIHLFYLYTLLWWVDQLSIRSIPSPANSLVVSVVGLELCTTFMWFEFDFRNSNSCLVHPLARCLCGS